MIIYCVESFPGTEDWANEFYATLAEGRQALVACTKAELPAKLLKLDVPTGKDGFVAFLNVKDSNHMNLPGIEQVARNY